MAVLDIIMKMRQEMEEELVSNILPFWINRMTDEVNGGFYGRITGREEVNTDDDKAGFWKCPYHNGRMCMEIMDRFLPETYKKQ